MMWNIEYTDEFGAWWSLLNESEQDDIAATVDSLKQKGHRCHFLSARALNVLNTVI